MIKIRKFTTAIGLLVFGLSTVNAQELPLSQQMSQTAMHLWKDSFALRQGSPANWSYDMGVILKGIEGIWYATGDPQYFNHIQKSIDFFVTDQGDIKRYRPDEYNIDHINNGKNILTLYRVTGKEKYRKAAELLRKQLITHPRTKEGGFWHKNIYPWQMWLDGLYMAQPFYAEYAALFREDTIFNDIANQFRYMENHARDAKTGLLYHGWDESKEQQWADKTTGLSANFWGRALGWFGMAMVDALDHFPADHPGRKTIIDILNRFANAVVSVQDTKNGLWYDVVDMPNEPRNYHEASASAMLVYTLAKGVRKGYLPLHFTNNAEKGFEGIKQKFIEKDANGITNLKGTVMVSGLGGKTNRDGSFDYYMSEPVIVNDPKGIGAVIKCAVEMEMVPTLSHARGKQVVFDNYFNYETQKDALGNTIVHHYTLNQMSHGGYSLFGHTFNRYGATTEMLIAAPSKKTLRNKDVYVIVDPDTEKETAAPNYVKKAHIKAIEKWVKKGGVLVLLSNDAGNAEFENFNILAARFGIQFNEDNYNLVKNDQYEQGVVKVGAGNPIFKEGRKLFIKELSTLQVSPPAQTILTKEGKNIMATAKVGKGTVFALGDPWIYNEYSDGRKLPLEYDNFGAMHDWVKWLLAQ